MQFLICVFHGRSNESPVLLSKIIKFLANQTVCLLSTTPQMIVG